MEEKENYDLAKLILRSYLFGIVLLIKGSGALRIWLRGRLGGELFPTHCFPLLLMVLEILVELLYQL